MNITIYDVIFGSIGGIFIGVASAIMWLLLGRITGISGILSGIFAKDQTNKNWRIAFIIGLILGGTTLSLLDPLPHAELISNHIDWLLAPIAGLLVGFGAIYGSGCTSGHGVCGLSRLSKRSFVAIALFIVSGMITVTILQLLK